MIFQEIGLHFLESARYSDLYQKRYPEETINTWANEAFENTNWELLSPDDIPIVFLDFIKHGRDTFPGIPLADPKDGKFHETWELYPQSVDPDPDMLYKEILKDHGSLKAGLIYFIDKFLSLDSILTKEEIKLKESRLDDMGQLSALRNNFNMKKQSYLRVQEILIPSESEGGK